MVTTPIFYVNAPPHIGHLYSALLGDALTRWHRLLGGRACLVTGTDEHGLKVQQAAERAGQSPAEFCSAVSARFRGLFQRADIKFDRFVRTTEPDHIRAVTAFWHRLVEGGHVYLGEYSGWYRMFVNARRWVG